MSTTRNALRCAGLAAFVLLLSTTAHADPCTAIPDRGPMPTYVRLGAPLTGPVTHIGDGDGLCLAAVAGRERDPATWVEVRLADWFAPELDEPGGRQAKMALERVAAGRRLTCTPVRGQNGKIRTYDRVVAVCRTGGRSLSDLLRAVGAREGGRGRR